MPCKYHIILLIGYVHSFLMINTYKNWYFDHFFSILIRKWNEKFVKKMYRQLMSVWILNELVCSIFEDGLTTNQWISAHQPFNPKLNAIDKHIMLNELGSTQRKCLGKCDHLTNPHDGGVIHFIVMELWNDLFLSLESQTLWRPIDKRSTFGKFELLFFSFFKFN